MDLYLEHDFDEIERVDREIDREKRVAVALCGFDPPCQFHAAQAIEVSR